MHNAGGLTKMSFSCTTTLSYFENRFAKNITKPQNKVEPHFRVSAVVNRSSKSFLSLFQINFPIFAMQSAQQNTGFEFTSNRKFRETKVFSHVACKKFVKMLQFHERKDCLSQCCGTSTSKRDHAQNFSVKSTLL